MYKVIKILDQVSQTSSRNEKLDILKANKENSLLQKVLEYTYNPFKIYGMGEKSINNTDVKPNSHNINCIFELLDKLSISNINDRLKNKVNSFIQSAEDERLRDLYTKMVLKDLRLGATSSTINKVWKGLIPEFKVMLAKSYNDRVDKIQGQELAISIKLDGIRCLARKEGDNIQLFTRQGKLIEGCIDIEEELKLLPDGCYDGELIAENPNNLDSKDLFNITRTITGSKGIKQELELHLFDTLLLEEFNKGESKLGFLDRKNKLHDILSKYDLKYIKEVKTIEVTKDHSKIKEHLDNAIASGQEGLMANTTHGKYQCKRSNNILKIKKFYTVDLEIVGIEEGTGRLKGTLGRLNVDYKGNIIGVGSGFSDEMRNEIFSNQDKYIGRIVEVNYFEESTNAKDNKLSLRFPTFSCIRELGKEVSYH